MHNMDTVQFSTANKKSRTIVIDFVSSFCWALSISTKSAHPSTILTTFRSVETLVERSSLNLVDANQNYQIFVTQNPYLATGIEKKKPNRGKIG